MSRLEWLDKQISIQMEALTKATTIETARIHSYLLEKLTDEWCELMKKGNNNHN